MSRYIRVELENMEPVRIADDSTSQHGQTDTRQYITGSALRGVAVNTLAADEEKLQKYKKQIFSERVHFLNAYPIAGGHELIPSLKGFYEDKTECEGKKEIENVLMKDVTPGTKRASLGRFCYVDGECIHYTDVPTGEDLNINVGREGKKNVFRSQYIRKGQRFAGYITFDDEVGDELIGLLDGIFRKGVTIGNRRSAGYGFCRCISCEIREGAPYGWLRQSGTLEEFYLVLLSDTVMRNEFGELTGLDLNQLAKLLGCEKLEIGGCATSTSEVRGYNRIWKGVIPSALMYSAGSVFRLRASGEVAAENFRKLEQKGIGIRKNEGFGQIAFFAGYEKISCKQQIGSSGKAENSEKNPENADSAGTLTAGTEAPKALCSSKNGEVIVSTARTNSEEFWLGKEAAADPDGKLAAKGLLQHRMERAMDRYITENPLKLLGISDSKLGVLQSICLEFRNSPKEAEEQLEFFIRHSEEKDSRQKGHTGRQRQDALHEYVRALLACDLLEKLKIPGQKKLLGYSTGELLSEEDILKYKIKLMIRQIRYKNREGRKNAG